MNGPGKASEVSRQEPCSREGVQQCQMLLRVEEAVGHTGSVWCICSVQLSAPLPKEMTAVGDAVTSEQDTTVSI